MLIEFAKSKTKSTAKSDNFYAILGEAIKDLSENGFDSAERISYWSERLRRASEEMFRRHDFDRHLKDALKGIYQRMIDRGQITKYHFGVSRFTVDRLKPALRAELDRRIVAATDLIKLRRTSAVEDTLRRFQGWATSIPPNGSKATDRGEARQTIYKNLFLS